jgi:renal tumor antigen
VGKLYIYRIKLTVSFFNARHATHMDFNFPQKPGTGIDKLMPHHIPKECVELIKQLLAYDPEERLTAAQALRHEYFRDLWEMDQNRDMQASQ